MRKLQSSPKFTNEYKIDKSFIDPKAMTSGLLLGIKKTYLNKNNNNNIDNVIKCFNYVYENDHPQDIIYLELMDRYINIESIILRNCSFIPTIHKK